MNSYKKAAGAFFAWLLLSAVGIPIPVKAQFEGKWSTKDNEINITNVNKSSFDFSFMGFHDAHFGELEGTALFTAANKAVFDYEGDDGDQKVKYEFVITDGKLFVSVVEGDETGLFGAGVYMNGSYSKSNSPRNVTQQENVPAPDFEDMLSTLLMNHEQNFRFKEVVKYKGQVYTTPDLTLPDCTPVPDYGAFAIIGDKFFYIIGDSFESGAGELSYGDLKGENKTIIAGNAGKNIAWAVGNKIIYTTIVDEWTMSGAYWYDVKSSKTTRLLNEADCEAFDSFVAFDDNFAYYRKGSDVICIRWDGSEKKVVQDVNILEVITKIEGEYYYSVVTDEDNLTTIISRYSIRSGKTEGEYSFTKGNFMGIEDGWAYYSNLSGIFKRNMNDGKTAKIADMVSIETEHQVGRLLVIVNGILYFEVYIYDDDEPCAKVRLYKAPINGGRMEYMDIERGVGC